MQTVILAAGQSSRLYPYGGEVHKSCIVIQGKSLIERTIESLERIGVTEVIVVVSPGNGVEEILSDLSFEKLNIKIVTHEGAKGMGEALLDAGDLLDDKFILLHAHHFEVDIFARELIEKQSDNDAVLLLKEEVGGGQFGIVKMDGEKVVDVVEKPKTDRTQKNLRIIGIYALNTQFIQELSAVQKEHYSFEKALASFATKGQVKGVITQKQVVSLKYPWDILRVSDYLFTTFKGNRDEGVEIPKTTTISGEVVIESGVVIKENVSIKGPCFIGKNAFLGNNAIVRDNVSVEDGAVVGAGLEIKHSILMERATSHSGFVGDSVIGKGSKLSAFFCSGNVRLDRANVKATVKDQKIDTGQKHIGVFIGGGTSVGIRVSTMPGVIIGRNSVIGPSTTVFHNIPDDVAYFTKFSEIIAERKKTEHVDEKLVQEKIVLFDIDYTLFDTALFKESNLTKFEIYSEVIDVLSALGSVARLGIFSEGKVDLQQTKLLKTVIQEHFAEESIHIVEKKNLTVDTVVNLYKDSKLILVDDKLEVLESAKKIRRDVATIWVKRGPFAMVAKDKSTFVPDYEVPDLNNVVPIIAGL